MRFILLAVCLSGTIFATELQADWLDVPFLKQEKDGCGAASIAMVMQYWQLRHGISSSSTADPAAIEHLLFAKDLHGIRSSDMVKYFEQHSYRTFTYAGDWDDLIQQIDKGRPLIAALKTNHVLHYVVVVGVDQLHQLVLLNDPAQRKLLREDRSRFQKEWKETAFWTLLALPAADHS